MAELGQGWIDIMEMDHSDRIVFCELTSMRKDAQDKSLENLTRGFKK